MLFTSAVEPMPPRCNRRTGWLLHGWVAFASLLFIALSHLPPAGKAETVDEAEQLYLARDYAWALVGFRRGAALGNATAQFYLGLMHADGTGMTKDDQAAYFRLLLSTVQGSADAAQAQRRVSIRDHIERGLTPQQRAQAQAEARSWKPKAAGSSAVISAPPPLSHQRPRPALHRIQQGQGFALGAAGSSPTIT